MSLIFNIAILAALTASCGSAKFRVNATQQPSSQAQQGSGDGTQNPTNPSQPSTSTPPVIPLQPLRYVDNKLLIVDFKSGWWNFHDGYLEGLAAAIATDERANFEVELHHLTAGEDLVSWMKVENKKITQKVLATSGNSNFAGDIFRYFRTRDLNQFTQIWVFSGADADLLDWHTSTPEFADFVDAVARSSAALYLASGQQNVSHVNSIVDELGLPQNFEGKVNGVTLNGANHVQNGVTITKTININSQASLFRDVNSLADEVFLPSFGASVASDQIDSTTNGQILLSSNDGGVLIFQPNTARKMILDGGIERSYLIYGKKDRDVMNFYRNLFHDLTPVASN